MFKLTLRTLWPAWCFSIAAVLVGLAFWSDLPAELPIHFNMAGEPDRFSPRIIALVLLPALSLLVTFIVFAAAHFGQKNFREPRQAQILMKICTSIAFLIFGLHLGILLTSINPEGFSINEIIFVTMGVFLILFGMSVRDVAPNRVIGFRFPWNQRDVAIWKRTQDLFYRWFILMGVIFIITSLIYPRPVVSMVLLFIAVLMPTMISYQYARKLSPPRPRR